MDFRDTPEEAAFRADVRTWLRATLTDAWFDDPDPSPRDPTRSEELRRWWQRELYDAGWVGLTWPTDYGGRGGTMVQQVIFNEECARARAPEPIGVIGLYMAGPTILAWGTEEQKRRYLPALLSGDEIWCQGFSEPEAGSDLDVRSRAVRDGDDYVVNGQKVWTSYGHIADWCLLVTRSDPDAPKQTGFTYLSADMHTLGVSVRPLVQITGHAEFNELFFDDVRVPVSNRLGAEGEGWQVAMTTLLHERGTMGAGLQVMSRITLDRLVTLAADLGVADDPVVRERLASFQLDVEGLRLTNLRAITKMERGIPGPEGSMSKLLWERVQQGMGEYAMELLGTAGLIMSGASGGQDGIWAHVYLRGRGHTIEAGTTEILKNIVAERVLGLPRSR
jgi:alkylation response protein AidB-like acyl-CoA dehydrogenase